MAPAASDRAIKAGRAMRPGWAMQWKPAPETDRADALVHHGEDLARLAVEMPAERQRVQVLKEAKRDALRDPKGEAAPERRLQLRAAVGADG